MILALDVGNSQIFGGVLNDKNKIKLSFRKTSKTGASSDEIGVFLRAILSENGIDAKEIRQIAMCSVVPGVVHSIKNACKKYFGIDPFVLESGVKTGLKICYHNPVEVGADRIANAIAAVHLYPQQDLIVIDLGTATTFCAVSSNKEYLGGSIVAGLQLCVKALERKTAKLPSVEIIPMEAALGRSTVESIQSGLYFGHIGTMKEMTRRLQEECFHKKPYIIGTGGLSSLFDKTGVFDQIQPNLVLKGLVLALEMNK